MQQTVSSFFFVYHLSGSAQSATSKQMCTTFSLAIFLKGIPEKLENISSRDTAHIGFKIKCVLHPITLRLSNTALFPCLHSLSLNTRLVGSIQDSLQQ